MHIAEKYQDVCDDQANKLRVCVEKNLGSKEVMALCDRLSAEFDGCVAAWRAEVGDGVRVKGINQGDPPFQCAAMSCLVGECLKKYDYQFDRCRAPMNYFKRCVKGFYGSEYINE